MSMKNAAATASTVPFDPWQEAVQERGQEGQVAAGDLPHQHGVAGQPVGQHGPQRARFLLPADHVRGEEKADQADDHLDEKDEVEAALAREKGLVAARGLPLRGAVLGELVVAGQGVLQALGEDGEDGRAVKALHGHAAGHDVLDLDAFGGLVGQADLFAVILQPLGVLGVVDEEAQGDEDDADQGEEGKAVAEDVLQQLFFDDRFQHGSGSGAFGRSMRVRLRRSAARISCSRCRS